MSAGCIKCGDCCDPVHFDVLRMEARILQYGYSNFRNEDENIAFILRHWTPNGDETSTCDMFDRETRLCTAQQRPPVCRDYPWYVGYEGHDTTTPLDRERDIETHPLSHRCSYWADVPVRVRPTNWQPIYDAVGHLPA